MQTNTKNFRQIQSIQLGQSVTSLELGSEYLVAGCLDDHVYLWSSQFSTNFQKQPQLIHSGTTMGIIDLKFNKINTKVGISSMDSTVKIYDIDTRQLSTIDCQVMENWKIQFLGNNIVTSGDCGRVSFYDLISREKVKKLEAGEIFLTAMAKSNTEQFLSLGNNSGDIFIFNLLKKDNLFSIKPHHKLVRSLCFTEDTTKLLTSSDDCSIKIIDINSETVQQSLQGHKQSVTKVIAHPTDNKLAVSCSFDKQIKAWDLRMNQSIGSVVTGSPLWSCGLWGSNVVAGGQNGVLSIYSLE